MDFKDLFQGGLEAWGLEEWLIIGVGALIVLILLVLLFKPKKKAPVRYQEVQAEPKAKVSETKEEKPTAEPVVRKTEAVEPAKVEPKKAEPKTDAKAEVKPAATKADTETEKVVKYHVSQNKDTKSEFKGQWRVRKEGSRKTIKHFKTQVEAIKYAESLADNNDTSIVIHKRDGTIRKQDYTKKKSS